MPDARFETCPTGGVHGRAIACLIQYEVRQAVSEYRYNPSGMVTLGFDQRPDTIGPGDVVVSAPTDAAPDGLLVEVTSVTDTQVPRRPLRR